MPYRFVDAAPTADVGFVAEGPDPGTCFAAACAATLATMLDNPESLRPSVERPLHVEAESLDLLLLRLLEELVFYKDAEHLFLAVDAVRVVGDDGAWQATAMGRGEAVDRSRHRLAADVKAVTLHGLEVEPTATGWRASVVLDI